MIISVTGVIQVLILWAVIYAILKRAKGSRFGQSLLSVGILVMIALACTFLLKLDVLAKIAQFFLAYIALSTVVIFQPEIRRALAEMGAFGFLERPKHHPDGAPTVDYLMETLMSLAELKMGALIAIERGISLRGYEEEGVHLGARWSQELVRTIFTPPLPLHDGGMILRDGRIAAAHCIFPVSNNPNLIASGMRHRAAVGLSEETDALIVVVSEETGNISVAYNGTLYRYSVDQRLPSVKRWVSKALEFGTRRQTLLDRLLGFWRKRRRK